jgi:hypothetical protein
MTGFGANILGYDDPHDLQNVESDTKRNEVFKFYTEILPNRFNPEEPGALPPGRELIKRAPPLPRPRGQT